MTLTNKTWHAGKPYHGGSAVGCRNPPRQREFEPRSTCSVQLWRKPNAARGCSPSPGKTAIHGAFPVSLSCLSTLPQQLRRQHWLTPPEERSYYGRKYYKQAMHSGVSRCQPPQKHLLSACH